MQTRRRSAAVLLRPVVVDAVEASLQNGPDGFNAVGMRHAIHVLFVRAVDRLMAVPHHVLIGRIIVGVHHGSGSDELVDDVV